MIYSNISSAYIKHQLTKRRGECRRCGACCKFVFKCPFLRRNEDGSYKCIVHRWRPRVCVYYPIDQRDLEERNLLQPDKECGFYFVEAETSESVTSK